MASRIPEELFCHFYSRLTLNMTDKWKKYFILSMNILVYTVYLRDYYYNLSELVYKINIISIQFVYWSEFRNKFCFLEDLTRSIRPSNVHCP